MKLAAWIFGIIAMVLVRLGDISRNSGMTVSDITVLVASQAQLFETAKDRRVETEALFKAVGPF